MVINTNTHAMAAASNLQGSESMLSKSLARLSSGSRIVNPADDAAGLAVSMRLDAQIARLTAAKSNVGNAISFTQTQDGYLKRIGNALNRMSQLAMMAQEELDRCVAARTGGDVTRVVQKSNNLVWVQGCDPDRIEKAHRG